MNFSDFYNTLLDYDKKYNFKNKNILLHFRIGTSGGITPQKTQPFIISNDTAILNDTITAGGLAFGHNGVLKDFTYNSRLSDTQNFTKDILYTLYQIDKKFYRNRKCNKIINTLRGDSKFIILDNKGKLHFYGDFIYYNGTYYSNYTYAYYYKPKSYTPIKKADYSLYSSGLDSYSLLNK
jgi:predicted glutamine amidotransferase